ncbi:hypothetical protein ACSSS7_008309 [Eimeria intestinalis]
MREAQAEEWELLAGHMDAILSSRRNISSPPSKAAGAAAAAPAAPTAASRAAASPAPASAAAASAAAAVSGTRSGVSALPLSGERMIQVQLLFSGLEYWSPHSAQPHQAAPTAAAAAAAAAVDEAAIAREARAAAGEGTCRNSSLEPLDFGGPPWGPNGLPLSAVFDLLPHLQSARVLACRGPPSLRGRGAPTLVVRLVLGVKASPNFFAFSRVDRLLSIGLLSPTQAYEALGSPPMDVAEKLMQGGPFSCRKLLLKAWARKAAGLKASRANRRQRLNAKESAFLLEMAALRAKWPITDVPSTSQKGVLIQGCPSPSAEAPTGASQRAALRGAPKGRPQEAPQEAVQGAIKGWGPQRTPRGAPELPSGGLGEGGADEADLLGELMDLPVGLRTAERVAWLVEKKMPQQQQQQQQQQHRHQEGESLQDRIIPVHADFWAAQESLGSPDLLVALHACGGLSDAVVAAAVSLRSSFLICSCCFSKHASLRAHTLTPRLKQRLPPVTGGAPLCLVCTPFLPLGPCPHGSYSLPSPPRETLEGYQRNDFASKEISDDSREVFEGGAPNGGPSNNAVPDDEALRLLFRQDARKYRPPRDACISVVMNCLFESKLADSTDPAIGFEAMWGALAWRAAAAMVLAGPPGGPPQGAPLREGPEGPLHALAPPASALKCQLLSFPSSFSQKNLVLFGIFEPPWEGAHH